MNGKLPQRPRQHRLETESENNFRIAIPSQWVYRTLEMDYGIDGEVEIFDDSEFATGYRFLVQLKATDEKDICKALRIRLPLSKVKYYKSLNIPLLIVKFHSPSGELFSRWFHAMDPYYGKQTEKAITFRLTQDDIWTDKTPRHIAADVEAYEKLNSPHFPRPLNFSVSFKGDKIHNIPAYLVHSRLKELGEQNGQFISFDTDEFSSNEILIGNDEFVVKTAGSCRLTIHTRQGYSIEDANACFHFDIMVGMGLAIANEGHILEAAEIVAPFLKDTKLIQIPKLALQLSLLLSQANKMHAAFEIAEVLFEEEQSVNLAQLLILPYIAKSHHAGPESHFIVQTLKRIAGEFEKRGNLTLAGTVRYNNSNLLRGASRFREAVREYRLAAKLDPLYLKRGYYWQEFAGVLFESGRYKMAARLYYNSLSMEDKKRTRLLYADALLFSGEYLKAIQSFEIALDSNEDYCDPEWHLKHFAVSWLHETLKLGRQKRKTPQMDESFQPSNMVDSEIEKACQEFLTSDALYPLAWFNLGSARYRNDDRECAGMCFLLAALFQPNDLESWVNAFGLALEVENSNIAGWIIHVAYARNGETVIRAIVERFPDNREELYRLFSQKLAETSTPETKVIRTHEEGGKWHEIDLAKLEASQSPTPNEVGPDRDGIV